MPLRCTNCGELDSFRREVEGHANYTETEYLNSNGECIDSTGEEFDDYTVDEHSGITCSECDETEYIQDISQEAWERFKNEGQPQAPKTWKEKYQE